MLNCTYTSVPAEHSKLPFTWMSAWILKPGSSNFQMIQDYQGLPIESHWNMSDCVMIGPNQEDNVEQAQEQRIK